MRICVLGHSTSRGAGLPDTSLAWPWAAASEISAALNEPVEVYHSNFAAIGPAAIDYGVLRVEQCDPDVVIVPLASYVCIAASVRESMRRRLSPRVYRVYSRIEAKFEKATLRRGPVRHRLNRAGKWVTRRALGRRAFTDVDDVSNVFCELLRRLAQKEGLCVVALSEVDWTPSVLRQFPSANDIWYVLRERCRAVATAHRLVWADLNPAFDAAPDMATLYQPDGIHKTAAGHALMARDVAEAVIGHQQRMGTGVAAASAAVARARGAV